MNKKEKVFLILGITGATSLLALLLIEDWILGFAGVISSFLISVLFVDPLDLKARREETKKEDRIRNLKYLESRPGEKGWEYREISLLGTGLKT